MPDSNEIVDGRKVSAILVVHDGALWLPEVIASLMSQLRPIDSILAVDTGSQDASLKLLKNARLPFITMPRESGFGEAIAEALNNFPSPTGDQEWLWIIHDDCAPQPEALQALLDAVADRPQVAMAGVKLRGWYDRTHLLEAGVSIAGNGARWTGLEPREYDQGQSDGIHDVLSVSTAGALIRRDIFEELGGFDENLALFRDDVDLGWRLRVAGHSVIAVTDALAFHAQAASSERRDIDVKSAFLHRPLLLDRRNAAYVLLANSSRWLLPWIAIQLVGAALTRASGFLIAKLPGYAADEILAVGLLIIRPSLLFKARQMRRRRRLLSPRVIASYIPPLSSQFRAGLPRVWETFRSMVLPAPHEVELVAPVAEEDEDLLTPVSTQRWRTVFRRPELMGALFLIGLTSIWSRNRYGSLSGGALPTTPAGALDLWQSYTASWHTVGMGSAIATPAWIALLALASTLLFGKALFLMGALFWLAPLLFMWSAHSLLRSLTPNSWLSVGASLAYALSPVAVASINSGRIGTMATLALSPLILRLLPRIKSIENLEWQFIFGLSLLVGALTAFSLPAFLGMTLIYLSGFVKDLREVIANGDRAIFWRRFYRRAILIATPFLLCLPWSLHAILHPSNLLLEPGFSLPGGSSNFSLFANPGGVGAIPWIFMSPVLFILLGGAIFSRSARKYAEGGLAFIAIATLMTNVALKAHGNSQPGSLWVGSWLTFATLGATCAGVIILNRLREELAMTHFHYRHILATLLVASTLFYVGAATAWVASAGADSPLKANRQEVLPAFLALAPGVKTLVIRNSGSAGIEALSYYIARDNDALLADPDMAPRDSKFIDQAVRDIVDGSGIGSSKVLAAHGIKYLFFKNPANTQSVRAIDGLGGFLRNSSTAAGIVWKVTGVSGRLVFTKPLAIFAVASSGQPQILPTGEVGARTAISGPGLLSLAENYDNSWQIIQNGTQLPRSKSLYGLTQFKSTVAGDFSLIHDGTKRRAWLALQLIVFLIALVMALPAGRRKREISLEELA